MSLALFFGSMAKLPLAIRASGSLFFACTKKSNQKKCTLHIAPSALPAQRVRSSGRVPLKVRPCTQRNRRGPAPTLTGLIVPCRRNVKGPNSDAHPARPSKASCWALLCCRLSLLLLRIRCAALGAASYCSDRGRRVIPACAWTHAAQDAERLCARSPRCLSPSSPHARIAARALRVTLVRIVPDVIRLAPILARTTVALHLEADLVAPIRLRPAFAFATVRYTLVATATICESAIAQWKRRRVSGDKCSVGVPARAIARTVCVRHAQNKADRFRSAGILRRTRCRPHAGRGLAAEGAHGYPLWHATDRNMLLSAPVFKPPHELRRCQARPTRAARDIPQGAPRATPPPARSHIQIVPVAAATSESTRCARPIAGRTACRGRARG